ncbi:monovalent cation/H+ antiporter complex subunit F [Candidatus Spongiihabitans sp.]|uniref:monovalent cation/H+ antiporter complex subunit F n=1 Tax=Candidatus Spongiihabitans sp. TaxID=3101308 RepID=UPI003C6ED5F2
MQSIYLLTLIILLVANLCSLIRAGLGPTLFDRILAANTFGSQTILLIAIYFFATGHPQYIDIALLYALIHYVGSIALVDYFNRQDEPMGAPTDGSTTNGTADD